MAAARRHRIEPNAWLERAGELPTEPGVYLMKDHAGEVIYVGKAKNLRARVRQYFSEGTSDYRAFIAHLGEELADLETVIARSEKEALILERELIARHEPRYNVIWRDDKQYLCLRVDTEHEYPRIEVVRRMGKDGARYFGPYHSATAARQTLRVLNRHFQLRTCRDSVLYNRTRPCILYQMGRCPAPCVLEIDRAKYKESVDDALLFLEGKGRALNQRLEQRMWDAAERLEYETAARYRNQIRAVEQTLEPQHAALPSMRDQDVVGLFREQGAASLCIAVLEVREGRVKSVETHLFEGVPFTDQELLESFLVQFYADREEVPLEVVVPIELDGAEALGELLSERRGRKVEVKLPQRGERVAVLELAQQNAEHAYLEKRRKSGATAAVLEGLKKKLHLVRLPERIECYDISNLQGQVIVGSRVAFDHGVPNKSRYRRYRVRSQKAQDDFAAMYEVLSRRLSRGVAESDLPDLIVIDGGKGQLNMARAAMKDAGAENVDLISLAKSRVEGLDEDGSTTRSPERVFLAGARDPVVLPQSSPEVLLLTHLRDEAHRFAISFHRELRQRSNFRSVLEEVPGVGAVRRKALLRHFGSLKRVKEASVAELEEVPRVGPEAARRIHAFFHGGPEAADASGPTEGPSGLPE
jgi:excinuclease ABC subunit C